MKIKLEKHTIREVYEGYVNNDDENAVVGFNGKLNIRPAYQREFIYNDKEKRKVIETIKKGFPLNVMYWADNGDGTYELIDGQQRTISFCEYCSGKFSLNETFFHSMTQNERDTFLDYELMIYICSGTPKDKLDWFETINIAGKVLTQQELYNALFSGSWVSDAKRYFSKTKGVAYQIGNNYISGVCNRQEYLKIALEWIVNKEGTSVKEYMSLHQYDANATPLWLYFNSVIEWVKATFPNYRKEMKGVDWGFLYNEFKDKPLDNKTIETEISQLMADDDVTNKKGIYSYILDRDAKHLNIRTFTLSQKRGAYEKQCGVCPICNQHYDFDEMEGDHITPWIEGGKTEPQNLQMLCKRCNRIKGSK